MSDVFNVDNPFHKNTGMDPEGEDGRTLAASPVEQKAAELLALVDDVSFWETHRIEKDWVFSMLPKGVRLEPGGAAGDGLAGIVKAWLESSHWQNNVGKDWQSFRLGLELASPEFKAELKEQLLGAGRLKTIMLTLCESLTGKEFTFRGSQIRRRLCWTNF